VINHWLPDGAKDNPVDRWGPRQRLVQALDEVLGADVDTEYCRDAVECKLFGLGSEDYVVGSHEFYMGYALTRDVLLCLDMGHFHPTETIHDKLSSILTYKDEVLLHVSRGIRWDSDHVVIFNDDTRNVFHELVRGKALDRARIALDFFDGSINRIGAWVTGTRAAKKAILYALLEPTDQLRSLESGGDLGSKLALLEEMKSMPFTAVWDMFCHSQGVPVGPAWINEMKSYEKSVLVERA
jgi:L-rhamnose isomerase